MEPELVSESGETRSENDRQSCEILSLDFVEENACRLRSIASY